MLRGNHASQIWKQKERKKKHASPQPYILQHYWTFNFSLFSDSFQMFCKKVLCPQLVRTIRGGQWLQRLMVDAIRLQTRGEKRKMNTELNTVKYVSIHNL